MSQARGAQAASSGVGTGPEHDVGVRPTLRVRGPAIDEVIDRLVGEEPLEIRAAGPGQPPTAVAVTMRTPGADEELAAGFLLSEGLIERAAIGGFEYGDPGTLARPENELTVRLRSAFDPSAVAERHFVATASCGICGKASIDEVVLRCEPLPPGPTVGRAALVGMPGMLRAAQPVFEVTGGLHGAGLFEPGGRLLAVREDVGRHNALDKLIGAALLAGELPLHERIVLVSGRLSFELVQKAAVAGVPILAAVSAPSDLAVETAGRLGMTLVGFLRGDGFNVYTRPDRIDLAG